MPSGKLWNLPNMLSISRIPFAVLASFLLYKGETLAAGLCVFLAIATDAVDGMVARETGSVTGWGKILDPAADKIAFAIFLAALLALGRVPLWFLAAVVSRDLLIALGGLLLLRRLPEPPSSNLWGKLSTIFLSLFLVRQAFLPAEDGIMGVGYLGLAALALVLSSFVVYITSSLRKLGEKFPDEGNPQP